MKINLIGNINFGTTYLFKEERNLSASGEHPFLRHATQFFRYDDNDEFIVNLLRSMQRTQPLNILSAGCSTGEEVYSFAMALEDLSKKPNIIGVDVSKTAIEYANLGQFMLDDGERALLENNCSLRMRRPRTPRNEELKRRFNKNFEQVNPKFHEYKKKDGTFENCKFLQANITDIERFFDENSQDVILCRMVLYHLTQEDRMEFFKQAYKLLKPGGMLCIEPFGHYDYHDEITNAGFEHPCNNALFIYTKPQKNFNSIKFLKESILNNKSDFNHI